MDRLRQRARFLCTIALVLGLHLTIIWLLATARHRTKMAKSQPLSEALVIAFYPRPVPSIDSGPAGAIAEGVAPVHRRKAGAAPHAGVRPQSNENDDLPAPVDWADELARTARDAVRDGSEQKSRDFGFPHRPATPAGHPPQFGWDHAATHRVESIPGGGLLVNLNDNCVLVLMPFPFALCGIGKRKANGRLFDHMHDHDFRPPGE